MSNYEGDGAPPVANLNDTFKGYKPPDLGPQKTTYHRSKKEAIASSPSSLSYVARMQWIEAGLLLYTATHNGINAWHRAGENPWLFFFIILGVLSMEWYLHNGHKAWLKGELTPRQTRIFKWWGTMFFFFIVLGVLTGAQTLEGVSSMFIDFHYQWILPVGTVLLIPALYHLNSANEITRAETEAAQYGLLAKAEEIREANATRYAAVLDKRNERALIGDLKNLLGDATEKRIKSRASRKDIKFKAETEATNLLEKAGITTETKPVKK